MLIYRGKTYTLGYLTDSLSYQSITVLGQYEFPLYSGNFAFDTSKFIYRDKTSPSTHIDNISEFRGNFDTMPDTYFAPYFSSSNTEYTEGRQQCLALFNLMGVSTISRNDAYNYYTIDFGDSYWYRIDRNGMTVTVLDKQNTTLYVEQLVFGSPFIGYYDRGQSAATYMINIYFADATTQSLYRIYTYYQYDASANRHDLASGCNVVTLGLADYLKSSLGLGDEYDISNFTATLNQYNWRYTGEFITPTLTIINPYTQETLVENTDYTKTYTNNLNVGTANVLAAGIGNYTGSKSINFYIIAKDISISVNCTLNKYTWEYTGDFITPEVQVWDTLEEVQLINGVDYQYTYTNNLNIGTATVTIVGIGNWTGTVTLDFQIISGDDPYDPGGDNPSGPGGGDGGQDDQSDPIPFPSLPTLDAISSGFATIYVPTLTELSNLANYMWSNSFENVFNRLFANPMDAVLGLSVVPCAVSYVSGTVFVGNIGTGVTMRVATTQYVVVDLGELTIDEFWGSYLDYNPYTRISAYLPYIGFRDLNADDIIGKAMRLHYVIDIVSGACVAMIRVDGTVLYSFSGSCAQNLPINSADWTENIKTAISVGATVGSMIATAGATAPVGAATAVNLAANAQNIIKPRIQNSGMVSGSSGFLGVQTPYLVITRPNLCLPANQNKYTGYPIYSTVRLDQLTGYTKVSDIQLDTIPATHDEIEELYSILTDGFIIQ